ncbi:hypothetical protein [Paenibacillus aceris]|uniref:Uncharacterized protein n=1 Tax=Paenibacillus aceris TaxID=869555 RepID=A0ABS4IAC7_9BACL|nr:hypothetical protein [Paenibacillus aceris]MBP1967311.1 hypothetical protein [Paenibacillus aceris]
MLSNPYQLWQEWGWRKWEKHEHKELTIRIGTPTWLTKREKVK